MVDSHSDQDDVEVEMHVRRQPLFKNVQQARNAADLLSSTSGTSIGVLLENHEQEANAIDYGSIVCSGPFSAFRHQNPTIELSSSTMPLSILPKLDLWPLLSDDLGDALDENADAVLWPPNTCIMGDPLVCEEPEEVAPPPQPVLRQQPLISPPPEALFAVGPSIKTPSDLGDFTMSTAKLLLDHYQNITTTFYTPAPAESKTPWETLYFPRVLSTLGEIALTGNSSDAKVSLLFAVFAISAFRMDVLRTPHHGPANQDWRTLGKICRERATRRLQMALRQLSAGLPKKEKYKNILMPLLSMSNKVVSGEMNNAAHYLIDIERVIEGYGIPKLHMSRKVKMLHSIYLYLRILTEGTHIYNRSLGLGSSESLGCEADSTSGLKSITWDLLMVESCNTYDTLSLDFMQPLAPPKSTFEQIYSLPASLFKLILETTQLANELGAFRHHARANRDYDAFSTKVKKLEDSICEWECYHHETVYPHDPRDTPPLRERFPYHLTRAIYAALIIYFYRSVRDVNPVTLQPYVQQTIYHLKENEKYKRSGLLELPLGSRISLGVASWASLVTGECWS
ncbi:fungal-specific transcription factor domain-containing protein [Aspergillus crustosus]